MHARVTFWLVWLCATVLATAVGFTATHTVEDVVGGPGPIGTEYRPPATDATSRLVGDTPRSRTETFDHHTSRLTVRCDGRIATLLRKKPQPGWKVTDFELGPDEDVDVTLVRGDSVIRIEVYCNEGTPTQVISAQVISTLGRR